ncbi:hypothetical protein MMC11_005790 [Xylographa trunciseda]|nr:hypothetical protein [Xylographa trunciseda]
MLYMITSLLISLHAVVSQTVTGDPSSPSDPPAYPSDTDPSTANFQGTRLFGWDACASSERTIISNAYYDMSVIAQTSGVYSGIDWDQAAALEFLGPSIGGDAVTTERRTQIQNVLQQVQQLYPTFPVTPIRPSLWIHVRCSGGTGTGDPNDICRDVKPTQPTCWNGQAPANTEDDVQLQAYSDPEGDKNGYSQITFCNKFFDARTLSEAITYGKMQGGSEKYNLQNYDNRARIFYHEATHLDYFMNAPPNAQTSDWLVTIKTGRKFDDYEAYGAYYTKVLAKYNGKGYYTQRSSDNLAFFALAKYVQSQIGSYPQFPVAIQRPYRAPRLPKTKAVVEYDIIDGIAVFDDGEETALDIDPEYNFDVPGCPDRHGSYPTATNLTIDDVVDSTSYPSSYNLQADAWAANYLSFDPLINLTLRILPLGDSITNGYQSTDGNGYRLDLLYNLTLTDSDNEVTFIGSVRAGTMANNENEGHDGAVISQIATFAQASLPERPNVVLLMAGTNDMNNPTDPDNAPARLGSLIDEIVSACPDAAVLVAQITPSGDNATNANIITYNAALPDIVAQRFDQGSHVLLVDMFTQLDTETDFADDLHPNDEGYSIMAGVWADAIAFADTIGWINPPVDVGNIPSGGDITCNSPPNWIPNGQIASGAGLGKNLYPGTTCQGTAQDPTVCICNDNIGGSDYLVDQTGPSCADMSTPYTNAVHFADLNGDGRAEYLWVDANGTVTAFLNLGPPDGEESLQGAQVGWLPQGVIASGVGATRGQVQFADLNGDGRAEYLFVYPNGSVAAWLNLGGPNDGPNAAQVGWLPQGLIADGIGTPGSSIMFADLNGDGRAEYLSVDDNGAVTCYLNLGPIIDDGPHAAIVGWLPQGVIATGVGAGRINTVFADINGDGRADYLNVGRGSTGSVSEWLNGGGPNDGPNAAQVIWYPQGQITGGDGTNGTYVLFADLNGDGRAEYIEVDPNTSAVTAYFNGCAS